MRLRSKIVLAAVAALLGIAAAAPWLIPSSAWIPRVESEAAKRLGAPVKIADVRVALLPLPHVSVHGLDVGEGAISATLIAVYPRLATLFADKRVLRSIEIKQLVMTRKGTDLIAALAAKPGSGGAAVEIERVRLSNFQVELAGGKLPALNADIALNLGALPPALPVERALVTTVDGNATLALVPDGKEWTLTLDASDWVLPAGPALRFNSLKAAGRVSAGKLALNQMAATLYGGTLNGKAELTWAKNWQLKGDAKLAGIDIMPLTQALKVKAALLGKLDASGPFSAQAANPAGLGDAIIADIGFDVRNGVLHGFDLANAAQSLLKGGAGGGSTQFDQLTGKVKVQGRAFKLRDVKVASGSLQATGNVDISATKQLSGRIDTALKGSGGLVGVPLAVSGTLDKPVLMPTTGSLVGAAIGSVLLPGVGTSVGSSVGDKIGKLFGK